MSLKIVSNLINIFKTSVSAVQPENLIRNNLKFNEVTQILSIIDDKYNLENKNVYVVGLGKAVQNMGRQIELMLGAKIKEGIFSIPKGSFKSLPSQQIRYLEGAENNLPDQNSESNARKIYNLASSLTENDILLVFISGGGSALLSLPTNPITLQEKTNLIKKLAYLGADITELNTVRKIISDVKGGKLALKAQPAQVISLIISDIVNDPLDLIASGPTTENMDENTKAQEIIDKFKLSEELPESIKNILNKTDDKINWPKDKVANYIIGSNILSTSRALETATSYNYYPIRLSNKIIGNVKDISKTYLDLTKIFCDILSKTTTLTEGIAKLKDTNLPGLALDNINDEITLNDAVCLIFGGETTVQVLGKGKGGRNQQLALEYSALLHKHKDHFSKYNIFLLSAGTDGIDGPTDAAGAIGYLDLVTDAMKENIKYEDYLKNNDSYNFFKKFNKGNYHVITGHTNTNVMDIQLLLILKK